MNHLGHDFPQRLKLISAVSMFLLIVIFYILQYIFDMDFVCSCRPGIHENAFVYLIIPPMILTWALNITDSLCQMKSFSIYRSLNHTNGGCYFVKLLISYLSLCAVWTASVLFDGDWYLCLMTNLNASQAGIPCKENLTYEEHQIKADYKTASLDYGLYLICFLIIVWSIAESGTAYYTRKKTWKKGQGSKLELLHPPYYRVVYEDLLAENVKSHLKSKLTEIAEVKAKAICKPYLQAIEDLEHPLNNVCDTNDNNRLLEAWRTISAPDFPFV